MTELADEVWTIAGPTGGAVLHSGIARSTLTRSLPSRVLKRSVDLVAATILCLLTFVIVLGLMVGAAISFRAMPLFTQVRTGRNGKQFRMTKIRSLPAATPSNVDKYELKGTATSGFGRFIRGAHLDELPQLWMVICGRMSLVGPRPDMPCLLGRFSQAHNGSRSPLRPGCTGLWQISPAAAGMIYEAPEYDVFYAEQMCARLDLWILWRTALQAVGGRAKTLDQVPRWVCSHPSRIVRATVRQRGVAHVR